MQLELCVSFLTQHSKINHLSQMLTTLAVLLLVVLTAIDQQSILLVMGLFVVILLGMYETMLAIRVGFDEKILKQLSLKENVSEQDLESLDNALLSLGLITKRLHKLNDKPKDRDLNTRLLACMKLFKSQALALILQLLVLMVISLVTII
ncbi:hypothetical protein MNBD_GAMMA12-3510 [hydrothermal vent metagenome]|uniref:Uncharacterized protein n=1 Tax=hydrothermal vent metagenome TaxID=652676 RepID=A0A3B0YDD9_9ZZZZ